MQTFLPYPSFTSSARVLDRRRLGKQRVETLQIMTALLTNKGWVNHPATLMWRRHEWALLQYQEAICNEWVDRGYKDTCLDKTRYLYNRYNRWEQQRLWPYWLGDDAFHIPHQSKLVEKDPWYYLRYFPGVPLGLEYYWPEPVSPYKIHTPNPWWNPPDPAF